MKIKTKLFGDLEISEEQVVNFPFGLPGFPTESRFAFLSLSESSPLSYLQSLKNSTIGFFVLDPFTFFKDYSFNLAAEISQELDVSEENPPAILAIATINDLEMTANLLAPIVINTHTRTGIQAILEKTSYLTKHPVKLEKNSEGGK